MKYISIDGCIGIGKSTITTQLANCINGSLLLEDFSSHPFLDAFYSDFKYTFETELNFLLIHYHQLFKAMGDNHSLLIGDYFFDKDKLFADANILSEKEIKIFMQLYNYLRSRLIQPDIIICLSGSSDMIYERVIKRNRKTEKGITFDYIDKINNRYESFFSDWRKNYRTIDIDMNENDFVKNPELVESIKDKLIDLNITVI